MWQTRDSCNFAAADLYHLCMQSFALNVQQPGRTAVNKHLSSCKGRLAKGYVAVDFCDDLLVTQGQQLVGMVEVCCDDCAWLILVLVLRQAHERPHDDKVQGCEELLNQLYRDCITDADCGNDTCADRHSKCTEHLFQLNDMLSCMLKSAYGRHASNSKSPAHVKACLHLSQIEEGAAGRLLKAVEHIGREASAEPPVKPQAHCNGINAAQIHDPPKLRLGRQSRAAAHQFLHAWRQQCERCLAGAV